MAERFLYGMDLRVIYQPMALKQNSSPTPTQFFASPGINCSCNSFSNNITVCCHGGVYYQVHNAHTEIRFGEI